MAIIEAGIAYAATLALMHGSVFPDDPWTTQSFMTLLGQRGTLALVDDRGGFVLLQNVLDEAEILTIGTTRPREGIGRALCEAAIERAVARGVRRIHLEVAETNVAARGLYAALGFAPAGRRKAYYSNGGDALTLTLDLDSPSPTP